MCVFKNECAYTASACASVQYVFVPNRPGAHSNNRGVFVLC